MKKIRNLFLFILVIFSLILGGCAFLSDYDFDSDDDKMNLIDDFEIVTDEKLVLEESSEYKYYSLILYAGEKYQIKTTKDDILGDEYYLKYETDDDISDKFTLSKTGYIETKTDLDESEVFTIDIELYKVGSSRRIARKYIIFSLRVGEYADITLTNDNLEYDNSTNTYTMTLNSGNNYSISCSVSYNTPYSLMYSLTDESYSAFMNVDSKGYITTTKTSEDKVGEISIEAIGSNGTLDIVYLKVILKKSEELKDKLIITNLKNGSEVIDGDSLTLYIGQELSFDVIYNSESKTNVMKVSDSIVLALDGNLNKINALKSGICEVIFTYESEEIKITINVIKDSVISISSENEGSDFIIINDRLYYLNKMYAIYESNDKKEITDNSLIKVVINDKDDKFKAVTFTYEEVSVTYDIKYYMANEYEGHNTSYDNNDYFNNSLHGTASVLPDEGTVKLLVIPVWFSDSNKFFNESQKSQIIEDIEYTMNGDRPDTELKSLKQYYEMQSYGAIEMDITVSDFYSSSTSYQDYTDILESKRDNTYILGTNAISWYFANNKDEKFEDYDLNSDGYLDGIILYYAANYYGAAGDNNRSYAFENTNYDDNSYSYNTLSFCPIGDLYGLARQEPSNQLTVLDLSETYAKAFRSSARTAIHEVGHMFGNDDLYESQLASEKYYPAGGLVMQDNNYGSHDPYHVNRLGWSKPEIYASSDYELGDKITIHLSDFQSTGQNIILTNKWNSANSLYDEYLILELFAPTALNEFDSKTTYMNIITSGIRLWHVNALLEDYSNGGNNTSEIILGNVYELGSSNYDVDNKYDTLHLIRNNPNEEYNSLNRLPSKNVLFETGDSFDMETFKSQFINGNKLDNGDKLGWAFVVEEIYKNIDGTYGAIITLERTDNVQTEFSKTITLNRSDLKTPDGEEDYSVDIFGEDGQLSFVYKYVTPPSVYNQVYPISSNGMCLFASADGNGGYIDLTIKEIDGKEVQIDSISITYSKLTNASITVLVGENEIIGQQFDPLNNEALGFMYEVNGTSLRIQNQYNENIDHWSVIALLEITINYTIK